MHHNYTKLFHILPIKPRGLRGAGAQGCDGENEFINIFISSLCHEGKSAALRSDTQNATPRKIRRKMGNGVSEH